MRERLARPAVHALHFARAAGCYWLSVFPRVRREFHHWRRHAQAIPDPTLRGMALRTQREKWGNVEGAAAFATFVTPALRPSAIRALVSYQAVYDYADTISEQPGAERVVDVQQIHLALADALTPGFPHHDYYAHHPDRQDADYLRRLVDTCRSALIQLPSRETITPLAQLGTDRIIRYQAINHGDSDTRGALASWGLTETPQDTGLEWWEICAAGASSLSVLALIAAAADSRLTAEGARMIEAAYFPWIGALHTLLDSLIDYPEDIADGQYSLLEPYGSPHEIASSLGRIAEEAAVRTQALPQGSTHLLLLAAMSSLYLSSPTARASHARPAVARVRHSLRPLSGPTGAILAARHAFDQLTRRMRSSEQPLGEAKHWLCE
jgi:tetraprenyl-beta-curcumene synthase